MNLTSVLLLAPPFPLAPAGGPVAREAVGRERDIWADIADRLMDTGDFDAAEVGHPKEFDSIFPADLFAVALVTPEGWTELDDADAEEDVHSGSYTLTLAVRETAPRRRYEELDRLADAALNALDGESFAGLTEPAYSKLRQGRYGDPTGIDQRLTIRGEFRYRITGFDQHDPSED